MRSALATMAIALALLAVPGTALAQGSSALEASAFGPLAPSAPAAPAEQQPQKPLPQPLAPPAQADDGMLSTTEVLVLVGIEVLLFGALGIAIARESGGLGRTARRARHARRARPPRRKRGATHSRAGAQAPPPPPRRRRAKTARRGKAGRR